MKTSSLPLFFTVVVIASTHCFGQGVIGGNQNGLGRGGYLPKPPVVDAAADPAIKAGEKVTLTGKLAGGLMAIGGETTGWELKYNTSKGAASIEVDMSAIKDAKEAYPGEITVTGQIVAKQYVERGNVLILKAVTVVNAARGHRPAEGG